MSSSAVAASARLAASGMDSARALKQAYALLYRSVIGQATVLGYMDTYVILAAGALVMFVLSFAMRKNELGGRRVAVE